MEPNPSSSPPSTQVIISKLEFTSSSSLPVIQASLVSENMLQSEAVPPNIDVSHYEVSKKRLLDSNEVSFEENRSKKLNDNSGGKNTNKKDGASSFKTPDEEVHSKRAKTPKKKGKKTVRVTTHPSLPNVTISSFTIVIFIVNFFFINIVFSSCTCIVSTMFCYFCIDIVLWSQLSRP